MKSGPDATSLEDRIKELPRLYDAEAASRLEAAAPDLTALSAGARDLARAVAGASPFLGRLIAVAPARYRGYMARPPEASLADLLDLARAAGAGDEAQTMQSLRRAKADAALLIGLAEISGAWTSLQAGAALADFADAAVDAALATALRDSARRGFTPADPAQPQEASGVAVIAMGKHGARELNYSSDIDLIVLFDPETPALGDPLTAREIAIAASRQLVRILSAQTADGYVFRTDLRLRPDPGASAAAVSVRAAEAYYEAHGQNWERAAFIKARAAAGDRAVGEDFLRSLTPFVWRKYLDYAAIEDIHSIKRQIHAAKGGEAIDFYGHDIKIGRGGIREIEFLAQTQQLILGGKDPALRAPATLDALAALHAAGRLTDEAHDELAQSYRYFRRVEHRLQMINDEQTHRIPRDASDVERLAAFLAEESAEVFERRLVAALSVVHGRFADLFEQEERLSDAAGSLIFTGVDDDPATLDTLRAMGFSRAAEVSGALRRWHAGTLRATRTRRARELLTNLAPRLLQSLGKADDPDEAFVAFGAFLERLPAGVQVFSLLANNPHIFDALIRIMTISPYLGRELSRRRHLIEALLESAWPSPPASRKTFVEELASRLAYAKDFEGKLNEARRWGAEEKFDAAGQLVLGVIEAQEAAERFTAVAEAAVASLLPVAQGEIEATHGRIDGALAVVGMGRLGASAMTATSDVDLVFIYEAADGAMSDGARPLDAPTYFLRVVRRLLTALSARTEEGVLFEVDMQLRPSGSKGPWAVSLSAFERYYEKEAWTWEEMALAKARLVAGDEALGGRLRSALERALVRPREPSRLAADVRDMRARLAEAKPAASLWDVKRAVGGLTDLDFLLAFLTLRDGARLGAAPPSVREKIEFLRRTGALDAADSATLLTASEMFEIILQLGRVVTGGTAAPTTAGGAFAGRLAVALGAPDIGAAEQALSAAFAEVRKIYERIVG